MNARMYVQDIIETQTMPTVKHGWALVFASPEAAAANHDPTATKVAEWEEEGMHRSMWTGASGRQFIIRAWWDFDHHGDLIEDGYLYDSWLNSQMEYEGILQ